MHFLKLVILLPGVIFCYQFYLFAISRKGAEKQEYCRNFGIAFSTIGIVSLVSRDAYFSFGGLLLIMIGLRLIAHGLDRLGKNVFIDRFDNTPKE